jgi:hypothetical protein
MVAVEDPRDPDGWRQQLLGRDSPEALAKRLDHGTKVGQAAFRKALWEGGLAAIKASNDTLTSFVRGIKPGHSGHPNRV